jgi:hypothetical protein
VDLRLDRDQLCFDRNEDGRLLLVGHARREVIELLATGRGDDDGAADVDPMVADAGIRLEYSFYVVGAWSAS